MFSNFRRAFTSNLQTVSASPGEQTILNGRGIGNPTLQAYFVWRRSLMIVVLIVTVLSAGLSAYRYEFEEDSPDVFETLLEQFSKSAMLVHPASAKSDEADEDAEEQSTADKLRDAAAKLRAAADDAAKADPDAAKDDARSATDKIGATTGDDSKRKSTLSQLSDLIDLVAIGILPVVSLVVIYFWTRFGLTYQIMLGAFAFSFVAPILLSLCPYNWWEAQAPVAAGSSSLFDKAQRMADGLVEALTYLSMLLPIVLSLLPGVQRACVRVKTLLPQSVLPGWILVAAAPFYALFLLSIFVAVNQIFNHPLVLIGMVLIVSSTLIYGVRMDVLTRPLCDEKDYRQLYGVQRIAGAMTLVAGCLFLFYLQTHDVLGIHLLGLNPKTSLLQPLDLLEFILETTGRSMFMTVFGADLFMRMNLAAWKNNRQFLESPAAQKYDRVMEAMQQAS